uniref:Uncharacterized protein n=1 Tax=Arundo donax TaxID=35708 RepID=A0A0A8XQD8_ARUDO
MAWSGLLVGLVGLGLGVNSPEVLWAWLLCEFFLFVILASC